MGLGKHVTTYCKSCCTQDSSPNLTRVFATPTIVYFLSPSKLRLWGGMGPYTLHLNSIHLHITYTRVCMYVCVYTYIQVNTNTHTYTYIHKYIHTDLHTCVWIYRGIYVHTICSIHAPKRINELTLNPWAAKVRKPNPKGPKDLIIRYLGYG